MNPTHSLHASLVMAFIFGMTFFLAGCSSSDEPATGGPRAGTQGQFKPNPAASQTESGITQRDVDGGESQARFRTRPKPSGNVVVVRKSWAKIHSSPNENSRAIALVFGNDSFEVVTQEGDWVQVRFGRNRRGWIPENSVTK